ncbi:alpha/beta hydrolase [Sphingopyxis sp. KK2]|uniref:alpha/beta hydrolase n=1 Tax=Sphingopyxis sp. KK2 TaxID=1855727 RepID=UPI00097E736E|nr:alpha/beta hydrolase [Sphingopyxis sp. KK2]
MPSEAYRALVEQLFAAPMPADIVEMREAYRAMGDAFPLLADVGVTKATLGGRPAEWLQVAAAPRHIVLLVHGGGYCIGGLDSHRHLGGEIARQTGSRVAVIDYRLAPEHPYPAGLDDLKAAWAELLATAGDDKIALVGDSAGAGLVMALLADLLRDEQPLPASIYCMSPWADLSDTATSRTIKREADPLASIDQLAKMAAHYAGDIAVSDPRISSAFADFRGSPPVFIQAGTAEVLMDDALNLAKSLADADVDVDLELRAGMIHVWPWFFPAIPEGAEALARACAFLSRHFADA